MYYCYTSLALAALFTTVHSHAALVAAVGDSGTSQGFLVDPAIARNCTTISPCQQDATIIRDAEIAQNIVNGCGRTEINGNIDIGEQTENELAAGRMAKVSAGTVLAVTIHQVNADGAGPFECDMDETSNAVTTFTPLKVSNNVPGKLGLSQAKEQDFVINVQMPEKFNCIGASTGNICTVRCRNNAVAGPFGGCFAVQQTDGTGRTNSSAAALLSATQPQATQPANAGNGNQNQNQNQAGNGGQGGRGGKGKGNGRNGGNNANAGAGQNANQNAGQAAGGAQNGQQAAAGAGNNANAGNGRGRGGNNNGKNRKRGFGSKFFSGALFA